MTARRSSRVLAVCGLAWGLLAVVCGSGCNWVAAAGILLAPDPMEEAVYPLPASRRTLIWLDQRDVWVHPAARPEFIRVLGDELKKAKVITATVPYDEIDQMRRHDPKFNRRSVQHIARRLNADLVILCDVKRFRLRERATDAYWAGDMQVGVKVIEGNSGERKWPDSPDGQTMDHKTAPEMQEDPGFSDRLAKWLAGELASDVAKLFYKHEAETGRNRRTDLGTPE